jgi:hypothetical protein
MIIGIDFTNLSTPGQGVYTYSIGLLDGLLKIKRDIKISLFVNLELFKLLTSYKKNKKIKFIIIDNKKKLFSKYLDFFFIILGLIKIYPSKLHYYLHNIIYKKNKIIFEENCQVLICPGVTLSVYNLNIPTVLCMHDIMHVSYPKFFFTKEKIVRKLTYENSMRYCTKAIASSEFMKDEFTNYFDFLNKTKIKVIPEGVDINFFKKRKYKDRKIINFNLPKKFLFYPAQFWEHKNHSLLLRVIKDINFNSNEKINLILTGKKKYHYKFLKKLLNEMKSNVFYLGSVSKEDLLKIYNLSTAVVIPSIYESSSLVIYESFSLKKNVIASSITPFIELKNKFNLFFFNHNSQSSLKKVLLNKFVKNSFLKKKQINNNYKNIQSYDWSYVASKFYSVILEL